jgi:pyruvate/2-oxoglutarate dehydrogenase complex dihydrolipoamide acyltransferase (E2) component
MARAHAEVPPVTWVEECDFGAIELRRVVPLTLKAVAEALKEVPELNARLEGDEIVFLDRYDIGVAVQTEQGLVVPVVRDCDSRSLHELDADVKRLAEAAHAGKLAPEELRDGTFTVTSAGRSEFSASAASPSGPLSATARSSPARRARSPSPSTIASSTAPALPSSAWRSSAGSKAGRKRMEPELGGPQEPPSS